MDNNAIGQTTYLSVRQVARLLSVTPHTVYRMCHAGRLRFILTGAAGQTIRIPQDAVDEHITQAEAAAAGQCTRPGHACATPGAGPCNGLPNTAGPIAIVS